VTDKAAADDTTDREPSQPPDRGRRGARLDTVRDRVAGLVWLVAVLAALVLALGVLCVALKLNPDNRLVGAVLDGAAALDLGELKKYEGSDQVHSAASVKWHLVNWGVPAVIYLVAGKLLDRVIRP
jgi:hypothetical protein